MYLGHFSSALLARAQHILESEKLIKTGFEKAPHIALTAL
jgi:hypothetical protein